VEVIQCRVLPKRGRDVYLKKPAGIASNKLANQIKGHRDGGKDRFYHLPENGREDVPDRNSQAYLTCLCSDKKVKALSRNEATIHRKARVAMTLAFRFQQGIFALL
jgi:hypothetical protein